MSDSSRLRLSQEELQLFSARIVRSLTERPLTLPAQDHREQVAGLLRQVGEGTFYHLLGIDPAAGAMEVHEAYERVARLVHRSHARRLNLTGREGVLELLFERATLAYLTLSDMDRRKAYDRDAGPARWTAVRAAEVLPEEKARQCFTRAKALAEAEDFHAAAELLNQAVLLWPRPEYLALLGLIQAKNPLWLEEAAHSLQRALDLGSTDPEVSAALASVGKQLANARKPASGAAKAPIPFRKGRQSR